MAPRGKQNGAYKHGRETFRTRSWINQKYHNEQLSISQMANIANVSLACMHKWMKKAGIKRRNGGARTGIYHARFKGFCINTQGYKCVYNPNHPNRDNRKYVREHILVAEQILGRYVKQEECIHHINEDKLDNRPENLYLFSHRREHDRYHQLKRMGNPRWKPITQSNLSKNG